MNILKIKQAAEIAKAKTNDKRWIAAIDKAVAGVEGGWIVTYETHGIMVTTENGTYRANGVCQCKAFAVGQACKHRALARLVEIADSLKDETAPAVSSREEIEAAILSTWSAKFPTDNLADDLMARFGQNSFKFMPTTSLIADILAAIA